jgi:uroporphyrinogen-III decarboxylase
MYVPTLHPSPVQDLLENEMGPATFYYLLSDHRQEVEDLLALMHVKRLKEYEILARRTSAEVVIPVENTSSTLISPPLYRTYSLPQIRDYVDVLHGHGKKAVLHMCGHLKALLAGIRETGLDGIHACTPPPVGTTYYEDVFDFFGKDFVLFGAILNPALFHKPELSLEELHAFLERLYTPELRQAHMLLWVTADGLPTPLEKFQAIAQWMNTPED